MWSVGDVLFPKSGRGGGSFPAGVGLDFTFGQNVLCPNLGGASSSPGAYVVRRPVSRRSAARLDRLKAMLRRVRLPPSPAARCD